MKITLLVLLTLLFTNLGFGQKFEPLDLAKKLISKEVFQDVEKYSTGEFDGHPNGQDLQENLTKDFRTLVQTEKMAVINITFKDSLSKGFDTYLHFKKDSIWKICTFRSLAMTGILEQVQTELNQMSESQIDSLIDAEKEVKNAMFKSRADFDFQIGNVELILELDDNIIKHFKTNQLEFERLKEIALNELITKDVNEERSLNLLENNNEDYMKLFISSVSTGGYEFGNSLVFLIGGMIDNSVGYFYTKNKNDLPEMSPSRIIMIREIGDGWYMYKTT